MANNNINFSFGFNINYHEFTVRVKLYFPWDSLDYGLWRIFIGFDDRPGSDFYEHYVKIIFRFQPDYDHYKFLYTAHPWLLKFFPTGWKKAAESIFIDQDIDILIF